MKAALFYHDLGWQVMPLIPNTKRPKFSEWKFLQTRRQTKEEVALTFKDVPPKTNIGIVTGSISGLTVVDIDVKDPKTRKPTPELIETAKKLIKHFPDTVTAVTQTGGYHLFYQKSRLPNSVATIHPQIDIRSEGGFVVAAPSTINAKDYKWLTAPKRNEALPPTPEELLRVWDVRSQHPKLMQKEWIRRLKGVNDGERNTVAAKVLGKLLVTFVTNEETYEEDLTVIYQLFSAWNSLLKPPLSQTDLDRTFNSIVSRHYAGYKKQ